MAMSSVSVEQPVQTRPRGRLREEVTPIVVDPTIEGTVPAPFDIEQQSQRHHLTGIQVDLAVLGNIFKFIVYTAKQSYDKVYDRHVAPPFAVGTS